jgi:hypothetical protein
VKINSGNQQIRFAVSIPAGQARDGHATPTYIHATVGNLVLRARAEMVRLCLKRKRVKNPKHAIGKTKQYPMTAIKMIKTKDIARMAIDRLFLSLASLIFEIVSNFAIGISCLVDRICLNHALWA